MLLTRWELAFLLETILISFTCRSVLMLFHAGRFEVCGCYLVRFSCSSNSADYIHTDETPSVSANLWWNIWKKPDWQLDLPADLVVVIRNAWLLISYLDTVGPPLVFTTECRVVIDIWRHSLISFDMCLYDVYSLILPDQVRWRKQATKDPTTLLICYNNVNIWCKLNNRVVHKSMGMNVVCMLILNIDITECFKSSNFERSIFHMQG